MVSIIIERSFEKMVVLGVYQNKASEDTRDWANELNETNPECDVDVLQFDNFQDLNNYLVRTAGFIQ